MEDFQINQEYADLLIENSEFHKLVQARKANYQSQAYHDLRKKLTEFEVKLTSQEIIKHAEALFPQVGG